MTDEAVARGDHMTHPLAWLQNFTRLLGADASRAWQQGDAAGASDRVAAMIRIGQAVVAQPDQVARGTGAGMLNSGVAKGLALADAGMIAALPAEAAARLRAAVDLIDPRDPTRFLAEWEKEATAAAASARQMFSGPGGGPALADYLRAHGIDGDDDLRAFNMAGAVPLRSAATAAEKLSSAEIEARIAAAEALIPEIARGIRGEIPAADLDAALMKVRNDPSQLARIITTAPAARLDHHDRLTRDIARLRSFLARSNTAGQTDAALQPRCRTPRIDDR